MNIEFNIINILIAFLLVVVFLTFMSNKRQNENWTMLEGASQKWKRMPRNKDICDTGYDDENCKFNAINCLNNPNCALNMMQ